MEKKMLTIKEVASLLGVSASTVRRLISNGKLVGQKAGAQWRFDPMIVKESFEQGILSGISDQPTSSFNLKYQELREDEKLLITRWRDIILGILEQKRPSQVVVVDRRGAKLWAIMAIAGFRWGDNLWHSTAIEQMTPQERLKFFDQKTVLIFDDLLEYGKAMQKARRYLEHAGANVVSLVCVRNLEKALTGQLVESKAFACEDADDKVFSERVTFISRLVSIFELPLDVDHLVIRAKIASGITVEEILDRLSKWGQAFIVWHPTKKNEYLAITLDRPQFLDVDSIDLAKSFSIDWQAPCKVRFYLLPDEGVCYCSFITYPGIEASKTVWSQEIINSYRNTQTTFMDSPNVISSENEDASIRAIYWRMCTDLAIKLLSDFVTFGVAEEVGVRIENGSDALDTCQLRAAFGPTLGSEIAKRAREILTRARFKERLFQKKPQNSVPMRIRQKSQGYSYDAFACRGDLLKIVPRKQLSINSTTEESRPISYSELFDCLPTYAESAIGKVLDNELDKATIRPVVETNHIVGKGTASIKVWRGFTRGEFGIWFEFDSNSQTYEDKAMQRTLALGAVGVEDYLRKAGKSEMTATEFNKVFANLNHDWSSAYDKLFLGWKPYKFGPIPIIPEGQISGQYTPFHRFLVDQGAISEKREQHGFQTWSRFSPKSRSKISWQELYRQKTSAPTRVHVGGLMRIYAKIQKDCKTTRPSGPRSSKSAVFGDPLVVLAAARNKVATYVCCWYEFEDWKRKGRMLLPQLELAALSGARPSEPNLKSYLEEFAAPARLLFDKIEMYRNLPFLRKQIEGLRDQGDFEVAEILLETIDTVPSFESNSAYPIQNLEYASGVMRAFSSLVRQVMTRLGFDAEEREECDQLDSDGSKRDASYYLKELLRACPELKSMEDELDACVLSAENGIFTRGGCGALSKTFNLIIALFEKRELIPDPRPEYERVREKRDRHSGLNVRLQDIQISGPYAVVVADIRNFLGLANFSEVVGMTYDESLNGLLKWIDNAADLVIKDHDRSVSLCGAPADNVILAGPTPDEMYLAARELVSKTTKRLSTIDRRMIPLSALRIGIAWRDQSLEDEFRGIKPGLTAYKIAETPGRDAATITITKAVYDRLSPSHQKEFNLCSGTSGQGEIFIHDCNNDVIA